MIIAEPRFPGPIQRRHAFAHACANTEFDGMPLAIVEADRLHTGETFQCPGEANRGILPAREENKSCIG